MSRSRVLAPSITAARLAFFARRPMSSTRRWMGAVMLRDPPALAPSAWRDSSGSHTGPGGIIPGATYGTSWKGTCATPISSSKSKSSWSTTVSVSAFPERRMPGGAVNENACPHTGWSVFFWHFVRRRAP